MNRAEPHGSGSGRREGMTEWRDSPLDPGFRSGSLQVIRGVNGQIGAFREVLARQAVGVLIRDALPSEGGSQKITSGR